MYKIVFRTLLQSYPFFLIIAGFIAGIEAFGVDLNLGVSIVLFGILALYSHRMFLLDEQLGWKTSFKPNPDLPKPPMWAFGWRYAVFFALFAGVALAAMTEVPRTEDISKFAVVATGVTVASPVLGVALAMFGTVLPAAATGGDTSLGAAFKRGKATFFRTILRLIAGPVLVAVISLIILFLLVLPVVVHLPFAELIAGYIATLMGFLPTHMTAAALSMAYRETGGMDADDRFEVKVQQ